MVITRRTALAGIAAAGSGLGLETTVGATASTTSPLGHWDSDAHGLPCYIFTAGVPVTTVTPAGHPYSLDPDPVFLLGNDDLTLFAFASAQLSFVSGERGWVRLNEPTATTSGHAATLTVTQGEAVRRHDLLGLNGTAASGNATTRSFGCGTARYRLTPQPGLTVERILSVAPSTATHRAQPAVVITIRLTNTGAEPLDLDHVETVLSNPTVVLNRTASVPPVSFVNSARHWPSGVACGATATSADPTLLTPIDVPNHYNLFPPSLVLAAAPNAGGAAVEFASSPADGGAVALSARSRLHLAPGATSDIVLVVGLKSPQADIAPLQAFAAGLRPSPTGDWFRREWATVLAPLAAVPDPALRAELVWDGHALLAMATYAAYYDQTFIPQGMTYDYVLGMNAGPRDHLQHAMAAACFAPALARSSLLYTLCAMTAEGALKFTVSGNGMTADSSWAPSDQSLFLFYAVGEYLRITGDWSMLDATTPYLPREANVTGTMIDKLERAFAYLRDHVGTGAHGLVRLGTGDWNDLIYAGLPPGKYRDTAESQMNSAMVMAVMPPLVDQLHAFASTRLGEGAAIARLAADMRAYADDVAAAMLRDMDGRTYARRAWLAPGISLGDDTMFLEPQSFLLQAPAYPVERKRILLREMRHRLIDGEVLGPRQRERPVADGRMLPGTGENGGFWYSLGGQAIVGVATFDPAAALAMLDRMTFRVFGRAHATYWVGQWTAPDTMNAEATRDLAGLPRPMDDGLWQRMAAYCAHAHAWPIYSYFRIKEAA